MVFSDRTFLFLFLPVALLILFLTRRFRAQVFGIIFLSLVFYYYSSGLFVFLLILTALLAWGGGLFIEHNRKKIYLFGFISIIFCSLIYYKYAFFLGTLVGISEGDPGYNSLKSIILPIGISFFTFQAISYVIDVWRGDVVAEKNPFQFTAYLSFFPQLIAGPIVRYAQVKEDFDNPDTSVACFSRGIVRFVHGLGKKILIADNAGRIADACFSLPGDEIGFLSVLIGTIAYTVQIYYDFSGYSDMAIGLGLMAGIRFPENFNNPYSAKTVTEFWRRWHITLSSWFRDYLYIPLGGNRGGASKTYRNLFIVFLITGLWHGAAWMFIIWGLYHGIFLCLERLALGKKASQMHESWLRFFYLLPVIAVGWIFFRANSLEQAVKFIAALFQPIKRGAFDLAPIITSALTPSATMMTLIGCAAFLVPGNKSFGVILEENLARQNLGILIILYTLALFIITSVASLSAGFSPFLYFRF